MIKQKIKNNKGFTLIEMMVSMTLFSFVITIALGALFTILTANEKTKVIKLVVNNLNMAMEGMTREIRVGYDYDTDWSSGVKNTNSCNNGNGCKKFIFRTKNGCEAYYEYDGSNKTIYKKISRKKIGDASGVCSGGDSTKLTIIGSDVDIEELTFRTTGIGNESPSIQPRVLIVLKGVINTPNLNEKFDLQTTISQRKIES